jgi:hypothetical protein
LLLSTTPFSRKTTSTSAWNTAAAESFSEV